MTDRHHDQSLPPPFIPDPFAEPPMTRVGDISALGVGPAPTVLDDLVRFVPETDWRTSFVVVEDDLSVSERAQSDRVSAAIRRAAGRGVIQAPAHELVGGTRPPRAGPLLRRPDSPVYVSRPPERPSRPTSDDTSARMGDWLRAEARRGTHGTHSTEGEQQR